MHNILLYTNSMLVVSLIYFYFFSIKNWMKYILAIMLILVIITSQVFWRNPIKDTAIHILDAIIAKVCIFSFIIYTILFKLQTTELAIAYAILLCLIGLAYWFSNHYSNVKWCSREHIGSHAFLHYFCFIATFFVFL